MPGPIQPETPQPASSPVGTDNTPFFQDSNTPPPTIPDHELLRRIGGGSYGEVWLARNVLGEFRAVKVVNRRTFGHDRPYEREFEGIKKYEPVSRTHDSQVDILHVGRNDQSGYFYYVMELADAAEPQVSGFKFQVSSSGSPAIGQPETRNLKPETYTPRTLKHDVHSHGRLPFEECLQIGLALTTALDHLHKHDLVHRDVKPSNIIFINGMPKLADIGLVAGIGEANSLVGTEGYMAPEFPGTPQADLYSLGKVLYEISMGRKGQVFPELPPDWDELAEKESLLELNEVILKACQADLRIRYQSAREMHADLALLQTGKSVKRLHALERRLALGGKIGVAAMVLMLLVAGVYFLVASVNRRAATEQRLSPGQLTAREGTSSLEAYKKYVQGRTAMRQRNRAGLADGLKLMTEAVEIDPRFARAWGELFINYVHGRWQSADAETQERRIAQKLEELNPNSAETHFARAWVAYVDFDFAEADLEFQRAIQLDPSRPYAHSLYGAFLISRGRLPEARKHLGECESLDPGFWLVPDLLGDCFFIERNYPAAIAQYEKALRLAHQNIGAYERLGRVYEADHQILKAIDAFLDAGSFSGEDSKRLAQRFDALRQAFHEQGELGYWSKRLEQAEAELSPEKAPYDFAVFHGRLGHQKQALVLLEKALRVKDGKLKFLILDQCWDGLRDDERFKELVRKVGYRTDWPIK